MRCEPAFRYGYDKYGYDRYGNYSPKSDDSDALSKSYGRDKNGYDEQGYDLYGYSK
jgi:hypothetical protein